MWSFPRLLPKPLLFAACGALGCLAGTWAGRAGDLAASRPSDPRAIVRRAGPLDGPEGLPPRARAVSAMDPTLRDRLDARKAEGGDIQVSLMWYTRNDLDLRAVEPEVGTKGGDAPAPVEEVGFSRPESARGGRLDVESNFEAADPAPVENIVWRDARGISGRFRVVVREFRNQGDPDPTRYLCHVRLRRSSGGEGPETLDYQINGRISEADGRQVVAEFAYPPDGRGVVVPEGGGSARPWVEALGRSAMTGAGIALALVVGQNAPLRRRCLTGRQGLVAGSGGALAGLVAFGLGQATAAILGRWGLAVEAGRMVGWGSLGAAVGSCLSAFVPNMRPSRAILAGGLGGLAASAILEAAGRIAPGPWTGPEASALGLGAAVGIVLGWAKSSGGPAHLEVRRGPSRTARVALGARPVVLGSAPTAHVYLPARDDGSPRRATFTVVAGRIEFDDRSTTDPILVEIGQRLRIGDVEIEVKGGPAQTRENSKGGRPGSPSGCV